MEEKKGQKIYKIVMLILLTAIITALITTIGVYNFAIKTAGSGNNYVSLGGDISDISANLSNFKKLIDKYYLGEVDQKKLEDGAIKGYIDGLDDPYTEYLTKEEMVDFKEETLGNFVGIGIYMVNDADKNVIRILSPIKDTPAYSAGILPGDIISKVDGTAYSGEQMSEASSKIKGQEGTKVQLELIRNGETLNLEIERKSIKVNHVESKKLEGDIGYLKLSTFDEGCSDEFKQKFQELKSQNIKSLVIDIRNNGGGIVDEALAIAELMANKDETLLITVDKENKEEIKKAKEDKTIDMPIVVLTNENSASASEILAGIVKDNNKAKLVGTKTYGKGVIQELLSLNDGSGLKITTNEYYTPNRSKINKIGIEPDEKVELPEEYKNKLEIPQDKDTQLQKAIELLK